MDSVLQNHLLTLILFAPVAGAVALTFIPGKYANAHRWLALVASLVPLGLSIWLWTAFDPAKPGLQFVENFVWFEAINANYHLGVDGISLPMVLLTAILAPLGILFSFSITDKVKPFMMLFLFLETGAFGVFMAADLLLFFLFYEIGLIPMYFLINIWGSKNREYASFKFMIYTMAGSLGLLLGTQIIGLSLGSFDMFNAIEKWPAFTGMLAGLPADLFKQVAFWAFVVAFAIKVPVWPFHTWLPDAHTEAPTAGSMMLAGVLLKLGAYGFLRLVLPLYPEQAYTASIILAVLAMISIVSGAYASYGQTDFKKLVAYSSINHMGFVTLGVAVAAFAYGLNHFGVMAGGGEHADALTNFTAHGIMGANGAILQMFNHGLSSAGMFLLVGVLYDRAHTRDLNEFGGLYPLMPVYAAIMVFTSMASLGLPGLNGFVSEFMVVRSAWPVFTLITAISMLGLLMTGAYILKGIYKVLTGPVNKKWVGHLSDMSPREIIAIAPLLALMLALGVWPYWLVDVINQAVTRWLAG